MSLITGEAEFRISIIKSKVLKAPNYTDAQLQAEIWMLDEQGTGYEVELMGDRLG